MRELGRDARRAATGILASLCVSALIADLVAARHPLVISGPDGVSLLPHRMPRADEWALWPIVVGDPAAVTGPHAAVADVVAWWVQAAKWNVPSVLAATALAFATGTLLGAPAASGSRSANAAVARLVELVGAAPSVVLAWMVLSLQLGSPRIVLTGLVGLLAAVEVARTVAARRGDPSLESSTHAGRASGAARLRLLSQHVIPHSRGAAARSAALAGPALIALEAALDYLGLLQPIGPSWVTPLVGGPSTGGAVGLSALSLAALAASVWVISSRVGRRPGHAPAAYAAREPGRRD